MKPKHETENRKSKIENGSDCRTYGFRKIRARGTACQKNWRRDNFRGLTAGLSRIEYWNSKDRRQMATRTSRNSVWDSESFPL